MCPYVGGRVQAAYYLPSTCLTEPTPHFTLPASTAYHTPRTHPVLTHPPSSIYTQAQASSPEIIPPLRDGAPPLPSLAPCLLLGQVGCLRGGGSTARSGGEWLHSGRLFGCVGVCVCALSSPASRLPGDPPRHQQPRPPPLPGPQPPRHGHLRAPPPPTPACFAETQTQEIPGRGWWWGAPVALARPAGTDNQGGLARPRAGFVDSPHWFSDLPRDCASLNHPGVPASPGGGPTPQDAGCWDLGFRTNWRALAGRGAHSSARFHTSGLTAALATCYF